MSNKDTPLFDRTQLKDALRANPGCLASEELAKLAEDSSSVNPHVENCLRCQAELALMKSFEADEPLADEGAAVGWISARLKRNLDQIKNPGRVVSARSSQVAGSWYSRWLGTGNARWLMPISAILIVMAAGLLWMNRSHEPELRSDAGNGPVVYRSEEVQIVGPAGELAQAPQVLQWKATPQATNYKASIMEVDEKPLWTGETHDMILTIPEPVRSKMLPGKTVLWRVTALDGQGHVLAVSQLQRFSVQHKSHS
jgi:hypothetical protein